MTNFFIITIIIMSICNCVLADKGILRLVNVIFRHGDRTPRFSHELYPNDPYLDYKFDPPGSGQLTPSGERRSYNLGKFLRSTYNDFLGSNYISGSIEARSTFFNRTQETLKCVLKGLYPKAMIPITFESLSDDELFFPQLCPRYFKEYAIASKKSDVQQELMRLEGFMKNLSKWTGKTINCSADMINIYSTLEIETYMNLRLPPWTQGIYPNGDLLNGSILEFKILNYNKGLKKLSGGKLIQKFIEDMNSVKNGSMDKNRKMILYSGHDLNIVAVLSALGVFDPHLPKFSSAVILELISINSINFFIKVSYYLGIPEKIIELTIPGCQILCPLDQFINLMQHIIPYDYDSLCSTTSRKNKNLLKAFSE